MEQDYNNSKADLGLGTKPTTTERVARSDSGESEATLVGNLIDVESDAIEQPENNGQTMTTIDAISPPKAQTLPEIDRLQELQISRTDVSQQSSMPPTPTPPPATSTTTVTDQFEQTSCDNCREIQSRWKQLEADGRSLVEQLEASKVKLENNKNELEREVQRRVDLEQRFTEEAKRTTDQIEELIAKSDSDDSKLNELKKKVELYSRETSSMIESFTTNRELLTSQLMELRKENDLLLGKFIGKARDLQSEEINLPQSVEELQFHCLTLNEKLILATLAKERLEETLSRDSTMNSET